MTAARVNAILDIGIALARLHNGGPNWRQKLAANLFRDDNALALRSYFLAEQMLRVRKENAEARKAERKAAR